MMRSVAEWSDGGLKEVRVRHCSDEALCFLPERVSTVAVHNDEPQRTSRTFYLAEYMSCHPSPRLSSESLGPCPPNAQVFQPGWFDRSGSETPEFNSGLDLSFFGPSSGGRQSQLRPHQNLARIDPKLAALQISPIRPPILPPPVSALFLLPPPPYPPPTNQISQGIITNSNFRINPTVVICL